MRRPENYSNYNNYYNNCYNAYNGNPRNYPNGGAVYCSYVNGPIGLPYYPEPAMTIYRNAGDARCAQIYRPYGNTAKVPYEPLLGLGCYQGPYPYPYPYPAPAQVACRIRPGLY